jgi:hypothetical protein
MRRAKHGPATAEEHFKAVEAEMFEQAVESVEAAEDEPWDGIFVGRRWRRRFRATGRLRRPVVSAPYHIAREGMSGGISGGGLRISSRSHFASCAVGPCPVSAKLSLIMTYHE